MRWKSFYFTSIGLWLWSFVKQGFIFQLPLVKSQLQGTSSTRVTEIQEVVIFFYMLLKFDKISIGLTWRILLLKQFG